MSVDTESTLPPIQERRIDAFESLRALVGRPVLLRGPAGEVTPGRLIFTGDEKSPWRYETRVESNDYTNIAGFFAEEAEKTLVQSGTPAGATEIVFSAHPPFRVVEGVDSFMDVTKLTRRDRTTTPPVYTVVPFKVDASTYFRGAWTVGHFPDQATLNEGSRAISALEGMDGLPDELQALLVAFYGFKEKVKLETNQERFYVLVSAFKGYLAELAKRARTALNDEATGLDPQRKAQLKSFIAGREEELRDIIVTSYKAFSELDIRHIGDDTRAALLQILQPLVSLPQRP